MAGFSAIADVGETLRRLLETDLQNALGLSPPGPGPGPPGPSTLTVTLRSPKVIEDDGQAQTNQLSIFLYRVLENPDLRNRPPFAVSMTSEQPTPLALDLCYMLTAYSGDEQTRHRILGRAMQFMHENAVLQGAVLQGQLSGTVERIRITAQQLTQDVVSQVWQAIAVSMQVSAFYLVTPILIEPAEEPTAPRVRERILEE